MTASILSGVWRLAGGVANRIGGTGRLVLLVGWTVGSFIAGAGLVGDARGWWTGHPFLLNTVSALAGFCFGAPLVVLLFGAITERVDNETVRLKATALAQRRVAQWKAAEPSLSSPSPWLEPGEEIAGRTYAAWLKEGLELGQLSPEQQVLSTRVQQIHERWRASNPGLAVQGRIRWLWRGAEFGVLSEIERTEWLGLPRPKR